METGQSTLVLPDSAVNDETRAELRALAIRDTYFMAKGVIGFKDMVEPLHTQMCTWIGNEKIRKLGLVPRDHLKTSVWTIADSVRRVAGNANIRILLGNETSTNASHFLRRIEAVFERNPLFQWLFPEIIPDWSKVRKWNETEMCIPRSDDFPESTIETIGVGGAVVSRHYTLIKLDDLIGKDAAESADVMQKTIDWYQYCESLLVRPNDEIHVFGTRWAAYDLYAWILKNEGEYIDYFFRKVRNDEGNPIWPERFDNESLIRIRKKLGSFKYSCQYDNNPKDPEAGGLDETKLRQWDWNAGRITPHAGDNRASFNPKEKLRIFMRVDPAISEKRGAARSAIIVDGVHADGRVFLLTCWAKRCQPFEMIDKMFELQREWDCESVGVESVAYQRILKPVIEAEAARRGVWLNVVEMRPDSREKKENRIRGAVEPMLARGLIWVNPDEHADFLEEFREFPNGQTVDILDCFGYGPHQWGEPYDEKQDDTDLEEYEETLYSRSEVTGY